MSRKTKVEVSPHFNEILDMIKEGLSSRDISDYLMNQYDEKIAHGTINNYAKKIRSKANQEYYKKKKKEKEVINNEIVNKEAEDDVVAKGVSDLDALDNIIKEANSLKLNIDKIKPKYLDNYCVNSEAEIEKLKIQAKRLAVQAVNAKARILKDSDDGEDKEFIIKFVSDHDEDNRMGADEETT